MKPVVVRAAAEDDIVAAYAWYEAQRPGLGEDFLISIRLCWRDLASHALAFPIVYADVRKRLLHRFPYGVFFRVLDEAVVVLACIHSERDPRRWRARIQSAIYEDDE